MRQLVLALAALTFTALPARAADWNPEAFVSEDTLEFLTVVGGDEHWSTVWLVVLDGQVYVRLGSRAAARFDGNATKPVVKVRIAGQQFDAVAGQSAPEMAGAVSAAMADKYTTDIFVRWMDHPLTLRLVPTS